MTAIDRLPMGTVHIELDVLIITRLHSNWVMIGFRYAGINRNLVTALQPIENPIASNMDIENLYFLYALARGDVGAIREMLEKSNDRDLYYPAVVCLRARIDCSTH